MKSTLCLGVLFACLGPARAQTNAFTYQGRLLDAGLPANGSYDLTFTLFNLDSGPGQIGGTVTNLATAVGNGLFNVVLDFGQSVFTGPDFWLEIGVRTDSGGGAYTILSPRQPLLPVPYALHANSSSNLLGGLAAGQLVGTLPAGALSGFSGPVTFTNPGSVFGGSFTGSGSGLSNVTATTANLTGPNADSQLSSTPFKTPPMGWMTWNCCSTGGAAESNCLAMAHEMINDGLLALGYNLIQIDAGWQGYRDTNGFMHESPDKFPNGITNTISILHSLGFKVGIWHGICINLTHNFHPEIPPGWLPSFYLGSDDAALINTNIDNDQALINDARTFVQWGIDYVKLEGGTNAFFGIPNATQEEHLYKLFASTAQNLGKPLYIMGAVGYEAAPWMRGVINARRNGGFDVNGPAYFRFHQFLGNFNTAAAHPEFSGPGCYVSLDSLSSSQDSERDHTYMLMTAMLHGELVWDNFYHLNGKYYSQAACNANLIAIDKDPAALMARRVWTNGTVGVWKKPLVGADSTTFALAFFNTNQSANLQAPAFSTGGNSASVLNDASQHWAVNAYTNHRVRIIAGNGKDQSRTVVGNSATSLSVSPAWTFVPDQTSVYEVTGDPLVTTTVNLKDIGCGLPRMLCLDLVSNVSFIVTNSLTVTVPESTAYGFKLTPYADAVGDASGLAGLGGTAIDFSRAATTDILVAGASGSTIWISIANGVISRALQLAAPPPIPVANLSLWLSPGSIVTNANGFATSWTDGSSSRSDGTANVAPLYAAGGFGPGHPALQFFGTNYLTLPAPQSGAFTIFAVCSAAAQPAVAAMEALVVPHSKEWFDPFAELFFRYNNGGSSYLGWLWGQPVGVAGSYNAGLGVTNIFALAATSGGSYTVYDKGVLVGSGPCPPHERPTQPYLYLGGFPAAADLLQGKISEVICYNRALSPQEITNVTWYLGTNNNIPTPGIAP